MVSVAGGVAGNDGSAMIDREGGFSVCVDNSQRMRRNVMLTMAPSCDLEVERGPDWLLVRVKNLSSDRTENTSLAERIWGLLQQHFTYRLVLELNDVEVLDSFLIDELLDLYRRVKQHGGVMRICGLSPYN
jgi:hypothetical protein